MFESMLGLKTGGIAVVSGRTDGKSTFTPPVASGMRRFTCDQLPNVLIEAANVDLAAEAARQALGLSVVGSGVDLRDGRWLFWGGEGYVRPIVITEA